MLNALKKNGTMDLYPQENVHLLPDIGVISQKPHRNEGEETKGVEGRRRLGQGVVYKERTSGHCGDSGGGWGTIASSAACEAGG